MVPTLTPAFIIPEGIGGGISGGGQNVALTAAGVVAAGVIVGGLVVVAAPVVAAVAAKASLLTAASPLGLLAVGAFLKGLQQFQEWGLLSWRPQSSEPEDPTPLDINVPTATNVNILLKRTTFIKPSGLTNCTTQVTGAPGATTTVPSQAFVNGVGLRFGRVQSTLRRVCGPGTNGVQTTSPMYWVKRADGSEVAGQLVNDSLTTYNASLGSTTVTSYINFSATLNGQEYFPPSNLIPGEFAPGTRPQLFPQTLPDAPTLPAPPLREPLQTPVLPPPPDRRPLAPPVTTPRPGQDPARVPVFPAPGGGSPPGEILRIRTTLSKLVQPGLDPVGGEITQRVPVTPTQQVIVQGQAIGGPGQAPAPNLVAIAQELGRLERKNEILLSRPENGGLGEVAESAILAVLRRLLEDIIRELTNDVGGGAFTLSHACPPPGGGDPLPPVVVPYSGGGNPTAGILAKLDGLAALIQAHKTMGQPTCKTAISGDEVTIHFESDF